MGIVKFAIKRSVAMTIIVAVIVITGFLTWSRLSVALYPDMQLPVAAVITSYRGAGPEEVESQISKPLEDILKTISNVTEIRSQSVSGTSVIILMFNWGTDMHTATQDIREQIGMIQGFLPQDSEQPMVLRIDPNSMPVIQVGVSGEGMSLPQLQSLAEDVIEPRLSNIPELASITITGGTEREIQVAVDPVKLENYGLSMTQISQVLQRDNFNLAGGEIAQGDRKFYVRTLQQYENLEDIKNTAIFSPTGNILYLRDIAEIKDGIKDLTSLTRVNGHEAVGVHCLKQSDANLVDACDAVKAELDKIATEYGDKLTIEVMMDQSSFVKQALSTTKRAIVEGAILAVLVIFLFLRNLRSTMIIFLAIPLSIIATFVLLFFTNNTMNLLTLGGLGLGVGRMVDDSIVVFENIYRHRLLGKSSTEAALAGTSEVGNAVIAATTTVLAVFVPIMMTEGLASILFGPMALTVCFAILCSLFVALTVVPLLSSKLLTDENMQRRDTRLGVFSKWADYFSVSFDKLNKQYRQLLTWSLSHRKIVWITVTVLLAGAIALSPLIGAEFIPSMDSGEISVNLETDKGSQIEYTDAIVKQMESELFDLPEVQTIFTGVGSVSSGSMIFSSGATNTARLYVKLTPSSERDQSADEIADTVRQLLTDIPGVKFKVTVIDQVNTGGASTAPVTIDVKGNDFAVLAELSQQVLEIVKNVPGTREVESSLAEGDPEIQIKIDRQRAAAYGFTPIQAAQVIRDSIRGSVPTKYRVGGAEIDILVKYEVDSVYPQDIDQLISLPLVAPGGAVITLGEIASFEKGSGPTQIDRLDRSRKVGISADILNRDLSAVIADIKDQVDSISLPPGYSIEYGGQNKDMMESFSSLALALILAVVLVYAVMAIQYESFFTPFVIMFSVPISVIGVILGLLLTGRTFGVTAFIGVIMLVGIVVSNAIVLVDYIKQLIDRGMERNTAIIEAGAIRLRPILMTTLSTVLAMMPMAIGIGEGAEAEAPLATVVVGGLLVSTLITLVLIPVVYTTFDDWGQKISQRLSKRRSKTVVAE